VARRAPVDNFCLATLALARGGLSGIAAAGRRHQFELRRPPARGETAAARSKMSAASRPRRPGACSAPTRFCARATACCHARTHACPPQPSPCPTPHRRVGRSGSACAAGAEQQQQQAPGAGGGRCWTETTRRACGPRSAAGIRPHFELRRLISAMSAAPTPTRCALSPRLVLHRRCYCACCHDVFARSTLHGLPRTCGSRDPDPVTRLPLVQYKAV